MSSMSAKCIFVGYRYKSDSFSVVLLKVTEAFHDDVLFSSDSSLPLPGTYIMGIGQIPEMHLAVNMEVIVSGEWVTHKKYGKQLKIISIQVPLPKDKDGILQYLSSGIIKGVGKVIAFKLVECFGEKTLDVLDNESQRIKEIQGIGDKTAEKIISSWKEQRKLADIIVSICSLGLSVTYARKALKTLGDNAAQKIKNNPYVLVQIQGIGFIKADQIARGLGIPENSAERITAGLYYCLQEATYSEGHCYLPIYELLKKAEDLLRASRTEIESVVSKCVGDNETLLFTEYDFMAATDNVTEILNGQAVYVNGKVYLKKIYEAERYVVNRINEMAFCPSKLKGTYREMDSILLKGDMKLSGEQTEAVKTALVRARLTVISGLPGVGKTTSVKAILTILQTFNKSYVLAAPTGKASKRLTEQTNVDAKTIHRLLEVQRNGSFARNENNPLDADFVIIDEASMIDILMMESLLKAVQNTTSLILIGDPNQLPSVGPGKVLQGLIHNSLCPIKELTEIQRQASDSTIIQVAHLIHSGMMPCRISNQRDFLFMPEDDPNAIRERIVDMVRSHPKFTPDKIQVLSPMKRGPIGSNEINYALQKHLRSFGISIALKNGFPVREVPDEEEARNAFCTFYQGDRVMQSVNNYTKEVFNGEVGYVMSFNPDDKELTVMYPDKLIIYDEDELDQISLAYCLTVHKSQGSEFPCVIMPVSTQHYVMLYRNLIYTAVTRARDQLIIIGTEKAVTIAVKNNKQLQRYASLSVLQVSA